MTAEAIDETSYKLSGDFSAQPYPSRLLASYNRAMAHDHKLHPSVAAMPGMSGRKYRYLINNFVEAIEDPRYLEVGSWGGSTAIAAIYQNRLRIVCIDNWSEFGGPRDAFLDNINIVKTEGVEFTHIESDFRRVDFSGIGRFNIYLFDGPHEEQDQYDGVVLAQPALDDTYLLVVDDWNRPTVRSGTHRALADTQVSVTCSIEIRTTQTDEDPRGEAFHKSEWHNGYLFAVCKKGI